MKRYKRLYVVLAVLLAACIATFALSRYKAQKEQIQTSGETILSISADEVESLSWDYDGQTLSFHRDGAWSYDDDAAFPVDAEQMNLLLEPFAAFGAAFIIEDVDDLGQYGLDNPVCTIRITAGGETHTIQLGDYSKMDAQRYVSIGDGNVYLAAHDPLDEFDVTLDELIDQDDIPAFGQVSELRFSGEEAVLRRQGAVRARMVFAVGRRCPADYETPWGTLPLETETEYLGRSLSGSGGGRVLLRYVLRSGGAILGHYSLKLNIRERNKEHDQHD